MLISESLINTMCLDQNHIKGSCFCMVKLGYDSSCAYFKAHVQSWLFDFDLQLHNQALNWLRASYQFKCKIFMAYLWSNDSFASSLKTDLLRTKKIRLKFHRIVLSLQENTDMPSMHNLSLKYHVTFSQPVMGHKRSKAVMKMNTNLWPLCFHNIFKSLPTFVQSFNHWKLIWQLFDISNL